MKYYEIKYIEILKIFCKILYIMSPNIEEEINDDIATEIRQNMETIIKYYDSINTRTINIQKELNQLKYLLELKKVNQ